MWPFRRRRSPRSAVVRLAELETISGDYPVLSVGQSRLADSFASINFTPASEPRSEWATLRPIVDPRMNTVADVTISVDDFVIGYLRPPDLDRALELLDEHHTESLEVPCLITWSPAGPEVKVRLADGGMLNQ